MIRRLFTTFIDNHTVVQSTDMNFLTNYLQGSFKLTQLESLNWLHLAAPCFPVCASKVRVLLEPSEFYDVVAANCQKANDRIVMASLYLGTGELERNLVNKIHKNLQSNPKLKVNILLDYTRGTRGLVNSKTMCMPLITETKNFTLSLYHTPALRGFTKKLMPPRWNELVGLQHMKLYLFDETVIISGANLSNDYFTNRQDRYIIIEDKALANFYANLVAKVQEFSFRVTENAEVKLHPKWNLMPYESSKVDFINKARQRIFKFLETVVEQQQDAIELSRQSDCWVFPLVEMGQIGIHHDSLVTKRLLSSPLKGAQLKLATGYFNLTEDYMNTITDDCLANCSILMAHPNANGFYGAKGPAGGIPAAYSLIAKNFYNKLVKANQHKRVNLFEYQKNGWSYHAKGLWYYLPDSNKPALTLIGSSNFGERSVNRDLETQICLVTANEALQNELKLECDNLYKLGSTAEKQLLSRRVPKWVQAVVSLFRNYF